MSTERGANETARHGTDLAPSPKSPDKNKTLTKKVFAVLRSVRVGWARRARTLREGKRGWGLVRVRPGSILCGIVLLLGSAGAARYWLRQPAPIQSGALPFLTPSSHAPIPGAAIILLPRVRSLFISLGGFALLSALHPLRRSPSGANPLAGRAQRRDSALLRRASSSAPRSEHTQL
jgi:hypothetical protein